MAYRNYFDELWAMDWGVGIFFNTPKIFPTFNLVTGLIKHEYFNFAVPTVNNPLDFDLKEIDLEFSKMDLKPAVYLTENHQRLGYSESLIRSGFSHHGTEIYMGYDKNTYTPNTPVNEITEVSTQNFELFGSVALEVFKSFTTQPEYVNICRQSITGEKFHNGVHSKLYAVRSEGIPVACGGLFYSKKDNFGYLHCDGTLESSRGKGCQTDLICYRTQLVLSEGIDRIYSIVEKGSKSWTNYIKIGFNEMQTLMLLTKP